MNALTHLPPALPGPAAADDAAAPSGTLLNFVAAAVKDPGVDVAKLEALLRMQREIVADDARLRFNRAMSAVQAEMQPVVRDALNTQTASKYARLETIDAAMRPIYTRHGFSLSFDSEPVDGPNVRVACEVAHAAGHSKTYHLDAALDVAGPQGKANKTPLHGLGSSVSYLRRYLTCMIFHVVLANEDNDGNAGPRAGHGGGAAISQAQVAALRGLIADCAADPGAAVKNERTFLRKMGLEALPSIQDVPGAEFGRLRTALLTKRGVLAQRAASMRDGEARP